MLLDARQLKTPAQRPLIIPTAALADTIAGEWSAQVDSIRPHTMPLTQLAFTAIDRVGPERAAILELSARYAETDLVCYRADDPPDLAALQGALWDPVIDWARRDLGLTLVLTTGLLPVAQPPTVIARVATALDAHDDFRLAAVVLAAQSAGSILIALAMVAGELSVEDAIAAAQVDETFQAKRWGLDAEAEMRLAGLADDIRGAARMLTLLDDGL